MKKFLITIIMFFVTQTFAEPINAIDIRYLDQVHLYNDHLLISSWRCDQHGIYDEETNGVFLDVHDRKSYVLIKSIRLNGCDDVFQDNIEKVEYKNGKYYILLSFRYEDEDGDRTKLIVLDSHKLEILKTFSKDKVNESEHVPTETSYSNNVKDNNGIISIQIDNYKTGEYTITYLTDLERQSSSHKFPGEGRIGEIKLIDEKTAIFQTHREDPYESIIYIANLNNNSCTELFRSETAIRKDDIIYTTNSLSRIAYYNKILAIAVNRDLHVFNTSTGIHTIKKQNQENRPSRDDNENRKNNISILLFDQKLNRLLMFSSKGKANSYIKHEDLITTR